MKAESDVYIKEDGVFFAFWKKVFYFYHTAALWVNLFHRQTSSVRKRRTSTRKTQSAAHLWMIITVFSFPFCLCHDNCEVDKSFGERWSHWLWIYLGNCCKGHTKDELQMSNSLLWSLNLYRIWQFLSRTAKKESLPTSPCGISAHLILIEH